MSENVERVSFLHFLYEIRYIILFYVLGDWISTWYALPYGYECNPLPAYIIEKYGILEVVVLKVIFIGLLFYLSGLIKASPAKWAFTKHMIEVLGLTLTLNNLMVAWYRSSLFQLLGLL